MSSKKFLIINWEKISELWIYIYLKSFAAILSYIYIKHVWIQTDPQYCPFNWDYSCKYVCKNLFLYNILMN